MNTDWLNEASLQGIDERKKKLLVDFLEQIKGKQTKEAMAVFLAFQKRMRDEKLVLTKEESTLMIQILKQNMSEKEKEMLAKILAGKENK